MFQPTFESLKTYQCPDWFRDAKFGIWSHWGPGMPEICMYRAAHNTIITSAIMDIHPNLATKISVVYGRQKIFIPMS